MTTPRIRFAFERGEASSRGEVHLPAEAVLAGHVDDRVRVARRGLLGEAGPHLDQAIEVAIEEGNLTARNVALGYYALLECHRGFPLAAVFLRPDLPPGGEETPGPT